MMLIARYQEAICELMRMYPRLFSMQYVDVEVKHERGCREGLGCECSFDILIDGRVLWAQGAAVCLT